MSGEGKAARESRSAQDWEAGDSGATVMDASASGDGLTVNRVVELRGFEPLTSSMPWRRATNCAIAP